jgi:hypothetical protein
VSVTITLLAVAGASVAVGALTGDGVGVVAGTQLATSSPIINTVHNIARAGCLLNTLLLLIA